MHQVPPSAHQGSNTKSYTQATIDYASNVQTSQSRKLTADFAVWLPRRWERWMIFIHTESNSFFWSEAFINRLQFSHYSHLRFLLPRRPLPPPLECAVRMISWALHSSSPGETGKHMLHFVASALTTLLRTLSLLNSTLGFLGILC
jgi:hypothetical protein